MKDVTRKEMQEAYAKHKDDAVAKRLHRIRSYYFKKAGFYVKRLDETVCELMHRGNFITLLPRDNKYIRDKIIRAVVYTYMSTKGIKPSKRRFK